MIPFPTAKPERLAEPTWEIAHLFPDQGAWSEEEYLALETNHLVEFSHGHIEVLPMPTQNHQFIVFFLMRFLQEFLISRHGGTVLQAPFRVQLWPGKYREPDVSLMLPEHDDRRFEEFWDGADLVIEVVSGSAKDRERDLVTKRREYATAGILEYWIVDPKLETVTVLQLVNDGYTEHGTFKRGETVTSYLFPELAIPAERILAGK
ncbi:MAG: Uma2 family endonuclease [Caldilineaceae bacterium]|nr:Uma2 family endonuclease [Caldilineaceae bacterium]